MIQTFSVEDGNFEAYVSEARGEVRGSVILFQEIFGLNAFVRAAADWLAGEGYLVVAPDIFWRQAPGVQLDESERDRAMQLMGGLDQQLAMRDCVPILAWLRNRYPGSGIGTVGYCLGGKLACMAASHAGISAAISYYGVAIQQIVEPLSRSDTPILLHMAEEDPLCPKDAQKALAEALGGNPLISMKTYPGVGHAFARIGSSAYRAEAASRANQRTLEHLATNLPKMR